MHSPLLTLTHARYILRFQVEGLLDICRPQEQPVKYWRLPTVGKAAPLRVCREPHPAGQITARLSALNLTASFSTNSRDPRSGSLGVHGIIPQLDRGRPRGQSQHDLHFHHGQLLTDAVPRSPLEWTPGAFGRMQGIVGRRQPVLRQELVGVGPVFGIAVHELRIGPDEEAAGRALSTQLVGHAEALFAGPRASYGGIHSKRLLDHGQRVRQMVQKSRFFDKE